jgi:hypothetical protein
LASKRFWKITAASFLVVALAGGGAVAYALHRMGQLFQSPHHAPGTYYFTGWTGPFVPFRPLNEISQGEAIARGEYIVGTFDQHRRLTILEKRSGDSLHFRYEYIYDAAGKLTEERSWHSGESNPQIRGYGTAQ